MHSSNTWKQKYIFTPTTVAHYNFGTTILLINVTFLDPCHIWAHNLNMFQTGYEIHVLYRNMILWF